MSDKSIFDITNEAISINQSLVESQGELSPEVEKMLEVNAAELAVKIDSYAAILEQFEANILLWKARKERDSNMIKKYELAQERLKNNLLYAMKSLRLEKLTGTETAFKLRKNPGSVVIEDEKSVPDEYKTQTVITQIDKKAILKALRDGIPVSGCRLQMSESIMETNPDLL